MKKLRRILAFVLVMATVLSFALVSNAANEPAVSFTDKVSIKHAAAVNLLASLKVVNGYEDNSFKPAASVTRAEMAKILTVLLNGGMDVSGSYAGLCTFADSKSHWAAGHIGFCASAGLINGKNADTFSPDDKVTGYEASKMLLCALGYDAEKNQLTGSTWNTTAHGMAVKAGLLADIDKYKPAEPLSRDDVCQMMYNALQATMVETTAKSSVNIAGISIVEGVKNEPRLQMVSADYAGRASEATVNGSAVSYQQLVEECFPSLQLSAATNDTFGRPSVEWLLKGQSLGVSKNKKPVLTGNGNTTDSAVLSATDDSVPEILTIFQNGTMMGAPAVDNTTGTLTNGPLGPVTPRHVAAAIAYGFTAGSHEQNLMIQAAKDPYLTASGLQAAVTGVGGFQKAAAALVKAKSANATVKANNTFYPLCTLMQIICKAGKNLGYFSVNAGSGKIEHNSFIYAGSVVEIYFDATTSALTICYSSYYAGKVVKLQPDILDADGNITVPGYAVVESAGAQWPAGTWAGLELVKDVASVPSQGTKALVPMKFINTEESVVNVGSYLAVACGADANGMLVAEASAPIHSKRGVVQKTTTRTSNSTLAAYDTVTCTDKTTYSHAATGVVGRHNVGEAYIFHYIKASGGNYYYFTTADTGNYMYLYNAGEKTPAVVPTFQARLIKSDGKEQIVETDQNYRTMVGSIVTASVNGSGKTVLTAVGTASGNVGVTATVRNSNSTVILGGVSQTADTKTKFVVSTKDTSGNEVFTTYTGINKVPNISAVQYYAYILNDQNVLDTVFFINATSQSADGKGGIMIKTGSEALRTGEFGQFYDVPAIVSGEIKTLQVSTSVYAGMANGLTLFANYITDVNSVITGLTSVTKTKINTFAPAQGGNITLNGTAYTYNSNVLVYTYNVTTKTLAVATVEELYEMDTTYDSYFTVHEEYAHKPLAGIFMIVK